MGEVVGSVGIGISVGGIGEVVTVSRHTLISIFLTIASGLLTKNLIWTSTTSGTPVRGRSTRVFTSIGLTVCTTN